MFANVLVCAVCVSVSMRPIMYICMCVSGPALVQLYLLVTCLFVPVTCPAGQYRVGQGPGECHDCPLGSYRNESMENCTSCGDPDKWRTDGEGKTSEDDCKCECTLVVYSFILVVDKPLCCP